MPSLAVSSLAAAGGGGAGATGAASVRGRSVSSATGSAIGGSAMTRGGSARVFAGGALSRAGAVAGATAELRFAVGAGGAVTAPGDPPVERGEGGGVGRDAADTAGTGGGEGRDAADTAGAGGGTAGRGAAASETPGRLTGAVLFGWAVTGGLAAAGVVFDPEVPKLLISAASDRSLSREVALPAVATGAAGISARCAVEPVSGGAAASRSALATADAGSSSEDGEIDLRAMKSSAVASRITSNAKAINASAATARAAAIFLAPVRPSGPASKVIVGRGPVSGHAMSPSCSTGGASAGGFGSTGLPMSRATGECDSRDPRSRSWNRDRSSSWATGSGANASSSATNASRSAATSVGCRGCTSGGAGDGSSSAAGVGGDCGSTRMGPSFRVSSASADRGIPERGAICSSGKSLLGSNSKSWRPATSSAGGTSPGGIGGAMEFPPMVRRGAPLTSMKLAPARREARRLKSVTSGSSDDGGGGQSASGTGKGRRFTRACPCKHRAIRAALEATS